MIAAEELEPTDRDDGVAGTGAGKNLVSFPSLVLLPSCSHLKLLLLDSTA